MQLLYNDLVKARTHQSGSPPTWTNADGLAVPSAGELVGVYAADVGPGGTSASATTDLNEGFADFEAAAVNIIDNESDEAVASVYASMLVALALYFVPLIAKNK